MEIPIGSTVGGYRIEQKLGEGGMGAVYRARHRSLPKDVALKVLWPSYLRIPQFRERFEQEADVLCRLEHPNVVSVMDKGEDDDMLWIAMQFVDGVDLHTALFERGPFPPEQAVEIVGAVGRALDHAHERGLLHRDVKPANIMLKRGTGEAMLTDFGIAKDAALASPLTQTGVVLGTFAYSAPEQINGGPMDGRADVYSLGAVLFELLTGRKAFPQEGQYQLLAAVSFEPAPDLRTVRPDLSPALAAVVARALAKDPAQRYPTGAALAEAAWTAVQPRPAPATVPGAGQPSPDDVATQERPRPAPTLPAPPPVQPAVQQPGPAPAPRRRRAPLWIAAALVVVVAAIVLGVVLSAGNDGGGGGGNGGNAAATGTTSQETATGGNASGGSTALAVGTCVTEAKAATACDGPHAAEVYSDGECTMAALVGYLGGTPGEDPLTPQLTLDTADVPGGAVCTVGAPQPSQASSQGVLATSAGAVWRRCTDDRGTDVLCTKPHKTEVVYDGTEAADPTAAVDCEGRASTFLGKPFEQVQDKLTLQPDGSRCLLSARGDNVLTDSLHGLKSSALPIQAATD